MQLCKLHVDGQTQLGWVRAGQVFSLNVNRVPGIRTLSDILHSNDPLQTLQRLVDTEETTFPLNVRMALAPVDAQEIWAAGVTYKRSKVARENESAGAASFYDKVYSAERPELFFKSTADAVVGPNQTVRIRRDSRWSVPEPELALFVSPQMQIVGYSVGNDMSARDIEGENPLYLPQAKIYRGSCALGPVVTLADAMPAPEQVVISLSIERGPLVVFQGETRLAQMARSLESLVDWLGRENSFPNGAVLLTGTGVVPPDEFTLQVGDRIAIEITGIGKLVNEVA